MPANAANGARPRKASVSPTRRREGVCNFVSTNARSGRFSLAPARAVIIPRARAIATVTSRPYFSINCGAFGACITIFHIARCVLLRTSPNTDPTTESRSRAIRTRVGGENRARNYKEVGSGLCIETMHYARRRAIGRRARSDYRFFARLPSPRSSRGWIFSRCFIRQLVDVVELAP